MEITKEQSRSLSATEQIITLLKKIEESLSFKKNKCTTTLLTFHQACELLNIKESKLRKMVFEKSIPFKKVGRSLRFSSEEIINWLDTNSIKPN